MDHVEGWISVRVKTLSLSLLFQFLTESLEHTGTSTRDVTERMRKIFDVRSILPDAKCPTRIRFEMV